ncbi:MAG: hypothetical protein U9R01_03300 [candidate division WOR-3 bacterium]|nr:hypothetical protein [candidate division WOR-3 bacterium]
MPKMGITLKFGGWKFAKISISRKGDICIAYLIPEFGLHDEYHPKTGEWHIKSDKYPINPYGKNKHTILYENPKNLYKCQKELLDDIKPFLYEPSHNGEVYVILIPEIKEHKSTVNELSKKKVEIDAFKILKEDYDILPSVRIVKVKELQKTLQYPSPQEAIIIDPIEREICFYKRSGRIYKVKIEDMRDVKRIIEQIEQTKWGNAFISPRLDALKRLGKQNPNAFSQWIPQDIG